MIKLRITLLALSLMILLGCKNPAEDLKLVVDTDILKYTAMINVRDAHTGESAPANATLSISGEMAAKVYELSGKKDIRLSNGMVTIGLHPSLVPLSSNPIVLNFEINATGYQKETRQITFTATTKQQVVDINIAKVGSGTPPILPTPQPIFNEVSLSFTGICPDRTDFQIRPSMYIYFKELGSNAPFQYLGYMEKGKISTKLLALNKTYEFQIVYGGTAYKVSQKIENAAYDLIIQMPGACIL